MSIFVNDNTGFEITIAVGLSSSPGVHAHARTTSIRRSGEVGLLIQREVRDDHELMGRRAYVIHSGTILSVCLNSIVPKATTTKVEFLEV